MPPTLDLVWITDSVGWGVAPYYARHLRQHLRARVRVHDQWEGGLPAVSILARLRNPSSDYVRLIRNAEVIVISGNPTGLPVRAVREAWCRGVTADGKLKPPLATGPQMWTPYVATLKAIFKRIFVIRKSRPVILRTNNWYVPVLYQPPNNLLYPPVSWAQSGLVEECTKAHESYVAAIATAAAAHRVPVADVYSAINGPSHLEDPVAKGYIGPDGIHLSNSGRAVLAKTLANLGYAKVRPTR